MSNQKPTKFDIGEDILIKSHPAQTKEKLQNYLLSTRGLNMLIKVGINTKNMQLALVTNLTEFTLKKQVI